MRDVPALGDPVGDGLGGDAQLEGEPGKLSHSSAGLVPPWPQSPDNLRPSPIVVTLPQGDFAACRIPLDSLKRNDLYHAVRGPAGRGLRSPPSAVFSHR